MLTVSSRCRIPAVDHAAAASATYSRPRRGRRGRRRRRSRREPSVGVVARFVGRENVRRRLEPLAGQAGRTDYAGGSARIETADETLAVTPPFGLEHEASYDRVELGPLLEALA